MKERIVIYADDGKILTDGTVYGRQIFLAEDADKAAFYEIDEAEYAAMLETTEGGDGYV